jgi:hypothetical protein
MKSLFNSPNRATHWQPSILMAVTIPLFPSIAFTAANDAVMPPGANPHGTNLTEMAEKLALFDTSSNNPAYYPKTPFSILFQDPAKQTIMPVSCQNAGEGFLAMGGNTFVVRPGTPFFVPLFSVDDSPPIVGDFPLTESAAAAYFFGPTQLGGRNFEIIVDGQSFAVGPAYVAGPVTTPSLLDGGGTHLIQLSVFLTPLSVGTHVVTIRGEVGGPALFSAYRFSCLQEDYTYTVNVAREMTITAPICKPMPVFNVPVQVPPEPECCPDSGWGGGVSDDFRDPGSNCRQEQPQPCQSASGGGCSPVIYALTRLLGCDAESAKDLTQAFFTRLPVK